MKLWARLVRVLGQSRIRLPRAPFRPGELRPGHWVQLDSETWRVASRRMEAGRAVFRLEPVFLTGLTGGNAGAVLVAPAKNETRWTLKRGESELSFPPELLVVFPVV